MAWGQLAAAVISSAASVYGSKKAKDSSKSAKNRATEQLREDRNAMLTIQEPQRALGYGAVNDLAALYGWNVPAYTPLDKVISGGSGTSSGPSGTISVDGKAMRSPHSGFINDPTGLVGSDKERRFPATIDLDTGTVKLPAKIKKAAERSDLATRYLRGEEVKLGKKFKRIRKAIDEAKYNGYAYDPNAVPSDGGTIFPHAIDPAAGPAAGENGTSADGTAGNFARFFTSPDYQFRQSEQAKAVQNSAAARGNLFSGATGKALTKYSGDIASGEYGNYVNRLLAAAGMGQTANNASSIAVGNTGNNISQAQLGYGADRASAYGNMAGGVATAVNTGLENWLRTRGRGD